MPWATSRAGRLARRFAAPAIWASWRALEALLGLQFGLKKAGLRPGGRIKDSIQCATSVETPGFYKAVRAGRIRAVKGNVSGCARRHTGGWRPPARRCRRAGDRLAQNLPFLDADTRAKLIEPDGQYRLHRLMVDPDLPGLGFVGFISSFASTLSAELGAHWLAAGRDRPRAGMAAAGPAGGRDLWRAVHRTFLSRPFRRAEGGHGRADEARESAGGAPGAGQPENLCKVPGNGAGPW